MQTVMSRNEEKASAAPQQVNESVLYFPLPGIAPAGSTLFWFFNTALGTFSSIARGPHSPLLLQERQFTAAEVSLLRPLLESFPHYCPYEVLYASFYGAVTEITVEHCRQRLYEALADGTWNQEMSPLRNVLSRIRLKLHEMGINVASILETGYILDKWRRPSAATTPAEQHGAEQRAPVDRTVSLAGKVSRQEGRACPSPQRVI